MQKRQAIWEATLAKIPPPPPEKARWGAEAPSDEFAHLSLVIVEPRKHEWMRAVLCNVSHVWGGSGAGLVIFHGNLNFAWVQELLQELNMTGVTLKPLGHDNLTREMYSALFCSVDFYDNFETTHILVFQTDVLMRRRFPAKFFDYQYVGAPWK